MDAAGLKIDGTYAWNGDTTASGTWTARSCAVVTVNSVKINQKDFTTDLTNGVKTIKLTATTDPAGVNVSWSSSNETVAKVASDGTVTPVKAGTAKITAKAGKATASITVTVTGVPPLDPVGKNTIYATKPTGWGKIYAYVYTGDGATAASNAKWPGVEMTATTASDGCRQANAYRYAVPDDLAKGARVIFNDGGSQQYPGSREPGIAYDGGIVKWDGAAALAALECSVPVPVTSVSISGAGVKDGRLSLKAGASVQLTATVNPSNATDRKVTWTSSDSSVANVMGTGVVTAGGKAGKATVTASAGGRSASVTVTVTDVPKRPMTVYYKPASSWKSVRLAYRTFEGGEATGSVAMSTACGGWYKAVVPDSKGGKVRLAFTDGSKWDTGGQTYYATGSVARVESGKVTLKAPGCTVPTPAQPMTVYYKPASSWKTAKVNWRLGSATAKDTTVSMSKACGGWYRYTIADTKGSRVRVTFTDGKSWDSAKGNGYWASGDSMAVSGGQVIADVTPNCAVTSKQ